MSTVSAEQAMVDGETTSFTGVLGRNEKLRT